MKNSLEIKNLSVAFKTPKHVIRALDDVQFTLKPGKTLVLLGESGCGKSLTSLAIMRLMSNNAVYGVHSQINFEGSDLLSLPEHLMRTLRGRRLALIFQEPMSALNPVMTIGDQLAEALLQHDACKPQELKSRLLSLLEEVEMPFPEVKMAQYPHQLSGGQKQRVVIAMALACNPEILIADEPTTALDVTIQAQILSLLKKLQQRHEMSLLLITHDLGVVKTMADDVCLLYTGQVVEQASVADFFSPTAHPYVQQLLASSPSSQKRDQKLSVIQGTVPSLDALPVGCRFNPRCLYAFQRCREEMPLLQEVQNRTIRCHLYPEIQALPPLEIKKIAWNKKQNTCEDLLRINNLNVTFTQKGGVLGLQKQEFIAVDNLSFTLQRGKTLALVGESGCGKTTTSRAILRLLPASGELFYRQENILALKGRALRNYRKKIQIIFQDPFSSMNPRMTVADIISEGMHAQGLPRKIIQQKQKKIVEQVGLPLNSLTRYPHQFSGGQRQRICIARALAVDPEILICDEPTSALDISVQAQILNLLKELQQETGIAYLFITHNMAVVSYIADDVLVMKGGKEVEYGPCLHLFSNPQHAYTKRLLASVLDVF